VTDIFTEDLITQRKIPLFFQHTLSVPLGVGESYVDIKLLDKNFTPVLSSTYLIVGNIIYSNLQNDFDKVSGLSNIYFISYSINKGFGLLQRNTEILNNSPVFHSAEIDDIDLTTGLIIAGRKAYIIEEDTGSNFSVTLPVSSDYGVKRVADLRIKILPPAESDVNNPWFVRVTGGKFLATLNSGIKKYHVAEFGSQSFAPFAPFKFTDESSYRVSSRIIKTVRDRIALVPSEFLFPDVVVTRSDGTTKFALTSDPTKAGTAAYDTGVSFTNVLLGDPSISGTALNSTTSSIAGSSIDSWNGFIVLPAGFEISETDTVRSIYTYTEDEYEFTVFDFNPLSSSYLINHRVVLLLRPELLGSALDRTLYYLLVNEDGLVVDSDIDFTVGGLSDVATMIANKTLWYDRDPLPTWAAPGGKNFVSFSTVENSGAADSILILGDIYVREAVKANNLTLNDVRVRGGGIRPDQIENAIADNPEVEWYWDNALWDGRPFPGAAAIYVEVPIETLSDAGGVLTPQNIFETVNRHIALGAYPVVHAYNDYEPTVSGLDWVSGPIYKLKWTAGPADVVYDVYEFINEEFISLATGLTNNEYVASGLNQKILKVTGRPLTIDTAFTGGSIFDIKTFES
jgi:hypothetical protein